MNNTSKPSLQEMLAAFIEVFGETVDEKWPKLRRAAARMVAENLDRLSSAAEGGDLVILADILGELEDRLARVSTGFCREPLDEAEPYPTEGITFAALVHLARIEQDALAWGWSPEQLQALGLAIKQGESLTWPTQEWAEICDRNGNRRTHYRLVS